MTPSLIRFKCAKLSRNWCSGTKIMHHQLLNIRQHNNFGFNIFLGVESWWWQEEILSWVGTCCSLSSLFLISSIKLTLQATDLVRTDRVEMINCDLITSLISSDWFLDSWRLIWSQLAAEEFLNHLLNLLHQIKLITGHIPASMMLVSNSWFICFTLLLLLVV